MAIAKGWHLVDVLKDAGYSGKNLNRPSAKKLIEACQQGEVDAVVVYKVDRLTRKQRDLWHLLDEVFETNGIGFVSVTEAFDTTTAAGKAFLGMLGVFAQLERDLVSERTREALRQKKTKGEWVGRTPTGYAISDSGKLQEDAEAMAMIAAAKRLRGRGASFGDISQALGVPKTSIHRLINTHRRTRKAKYHIDLQEVTVP